MSSWDAPTGNWGSRQEPDESGRPDEQDYQQGESTGGYRTMRGGEGRLDKSGEGQEGPWLTYARMHTLRSPKHFTGPDLDIPSLTYQSWHEARFGEEDWRKLDLISRDAQAAVRWFRASSV